jgi:cobalamin biosynthesis protein CobT
LADRKGLYTLLERRFKVESRLRSFARLITQNFTLKVLFQGEVACIGEGWLQVPPVENTEEGLARSMYLVAHECAHDLHSQLDVKEKAGEIDKRLPYILNALEDARVEKLMIRRFEGLEDNMRVNIQKIVSKWDESMPIASQLLSGMFLVGRGFDMDMLSDDAQRILHWLEPLITQASEAPDSQCALEISQEILKRIDHILKDAPEKNVPGVSDETKRGITGSDFRAKGMSEFIEEHFDEVKLPPDHDGMANMEQLKDENQPEGETIAHPDEGAIAEYNAILTSLRRELNYLVQNLYSLVDKKRQRKRRLTFIRSRNRGVVDSRRLWKLCAGREDVFKQRRVGHDSQRDVDPDSLAMYLLVDESHSMLDSGRYVRAREAAIVISEALDRLGITFALTGYTASGKLSRILYKQFDESYTDVKTRLLGMRHRMGTLTAEHIPFALRRLAKRSERKRILIIITDADDIESPVRLENAILDAREAGVEVLGVGIHTDLMSEWYQIFIEITDLNDFARQMLELLKSVLQR